MAFEKQANGLYLPGWIERSGGSLHTKPAMAGTVFDSGTLVDGTAVVVQMAGAPLPCTVELRPVAGDTVLLEYTLNGTDYYTRISATVNSEQVITAPITGLRITRSAGAGTTSTWAVV